MKMVEFFGYGFRLAASLRPIRPGIHLYQCDNIRIHGADKRDNTVQCISGLLEKSGERKRHMVACTMACCIAYVIK